MAYISGADRHQMVLFPESLDEYIGEDNPVRVFDAFVNSLNMEQCGFARSIPAVEGRPGYDPRDLLKLYIYGYFNKIRSSRSLAREARRNVELMWLLNKLAPDFRTISDFRKDNKKALKNVFKQFNRLCDKLKLYSKEYISIDGSKFKAVNAKDRNFTLNKLDDRLKRLDNQIDEYMMLMEKADAEEQDERTFTKEEIDKKMKCLRERKETYEGYRDELETTGEKQKSLTDPEAKLMKMQEGYGVAYNIQTAVDAQSHLIAGFEVTDHPTDHGLIEEVAAEVKYDFGLEHIEVAADKGYRDGKDLMNCLESGIIPNVFPTDGRVDIDLETEYEDIEISGEKKASRNAEDIRECLHAGIIPDIYKNIVTDIEVATKTIHEKVEAAEDETASMTEEEMIAKAEGGYFVRDLEKKRVYCPEGNILRQKSEKKDGSIRYCNKLACKNCFNKCTESKFKEAEFKPGKVMIECHGSGGKKDNNKSDKIKKTPGTKIIKKVVRLKFKPDRKKLDNRKCLSEHPFGTIKRTLDGSYLLLKGKEKVTGEIALSCMVYNMKVAINSTGVKKILEVLA